MRLVIFYPSAGIGGAQLLFSRISESLAKSGFEIVVVDFGNGYISGYLASKKLPFVHIALQKGERFVCDSDDMLLLSLSMVFSFELYLHPHLKTRIAFWDLHPYNLIENTAFSFFYKRYPLGGLSRILKIIESSSLSKMGLLIDCLTQKSALYFMCRKNYLSNKEFFGCSASPNYLPIPMPDIGAISAEIDKRPELFSHQSLPFKSTSSVLNVGWISRLDADKVPILNLLLSDICEFASSQRIKVVVHVIGEGSASRDIFSNSHAELHMVGRLEQVDLSVYVKNYIDIGFSMGTSVLEFAAREKPAVMVPGPTMHNYFKNRSARYVWLYDAKEFDVAVEEYYERALTNSFEEIFAAYSLDAQKIAKNSKAYVMRTHNLCNVTEALRKNMDEASFKYEDYKNNRAFSRGWFGSNLNSIKILAKYFLNFCKKIAI